MDFEEISVRTATEDELLDHSEEMYLFQEMVDVSMSYSGDTILTAVVNMVAQTVKCQNVIENKKAIIQIYRLTLDKLEAEFDKPH